MAIIPPMIIAKRSIGNTISRHYAV